MSASGSWWREPRGFVQRFAGTFRDDGLAISGSWEGLRDGSQWEHDFGLTYRKVA